MDFLTMWARLFTAGNAATVSQFWYYRRPGAFGALPLPPRMDSSTEVPDWLCQAMAILCQVDALRSSEEGLVAWGLERTKLRPSGEDQWVGGMQEHGSLELAFAISGTCVLDVGTTRYRFAAPAFACIQSGVLHAEGFSNARQPYAAVWLSLSDAGRVMIHVSEYAPRLGWSCPWVRELPRAANSRILPWFRPGSRAITLEPLRSELLVAMSLMHRELSGKQASGHSKSLATPGHHRVLEWVKRYLDRHYRRSVTLSELAELTRYSPNYLDALFSQWQGQGVRAYLVSRRMAEAVRLLERSPLSVQAVAASVGYDDPLYFSRAFSRYHGYPPSRLRKGGPD